MTKKEIINQINYQFHAGLNNTNTAYASINKSKEVWWLNVPVSKFTDEVHLLLNTGSKVIWVLLPKGFAKGVPFKIREDKNAVDLEISSSKSYMYLRDVKSGGTHFDFRPYVKETINL